MNGRNAKQIRRIAKRNCIMLDTEYKDIQHKMQFFDKAEKKFKHYISVQRVLNPDCFRSVCQGLKRKVA